MPKLKTDKESKDKVEIPDLKKKITAAIQNKYKMTVSQFAKSEHSEDIPGRNSLPVYLSPSGSISFAVLKNLCTLLELGDLDKQTVVQRSVTYYLS